MGAGIRSLIRSLLVALITVSIAASGIGCRTPAKIREQCDHIVEAWQHLRPYLRECQTSERLAAGFTSELIHIRMPLPE